MAHKDMLQGPPPAPHQIPCCPLPLFPQHVLDLVAHEQAHGLDGLLGPVDVVSEEHVVGEGRELAHLEQAKQVVVLPVRVPADVDRHAHLQQHRLTQKDLRTCEERGVGQEDGRAGEAGRGREG